MIISDIEMIISPSWCAEYPEYVAVITLFVIFLLIYTFGSAIKGVLRL